MPEVLKLSELVNQDCMTKVKIWRGRVKARLDLQWTPLLEFFYQILFRQNFINASIDLRQLIFYCDHYPGTFPPAKKGGHYNDVLTQVISDAKQCYCT